MILVTTEGITGKELEMLGLVNGSTIQTVNAVRDLGAGLKTLVGGELTKYNEMMNNARALATKRMVEQAAAMGADAIVGIRYTSSSVMQSAAEVTAYGTAVRFIGARLRAQVPCGTESSQESPGILLSGNLRLAGSIWS